MSNRSDHRLDVIEAALTPKEAALVWMREAHACGSLVSYAQSLHHPPENAFPLVRLPRQMESAVRAAKRGQPDKEVRGAVRLAVRDVGLLYYLVLHLNTRVLEEQRANWLALGLVGVMLHIGSEKASPPLLASWREHTQEVAHDLYVRQGTVRAVADQHFDGTTPLFPEAAEDVAAQVTRIERVVDIYNGGIIERRPTRSKRAPLFPEPLDLAQLRAAAAPAIEAEMGLTVDLAKAEAWNLIDEREQGLAQMRPHVWKDSS